MKNEIKQQEYIYDNKSWTIAKEFIFNKSTFVILYSGDSDWFKVIRKEELIKKEDSYQYQQKLKLVKEIADLDKEKEKKIKELQDQAIKSMISRLRINTAFSEDGGKLASITLVIVQELEKLILNNK